MGLRSTFTDGEEDEDAVAEFVVWYKYATLPRNVEDGGNTSGWGVKASLRLTGSVTYCDVDCVGRLAVVVKEDEPCTVYLYDLGGEDGGRGRGEDDMGGGLSIGGRVKAVNVETGGGRVVVGTREGGIEVWDMVKMTRIWDIKVRERLKGGGKGCSALSLKKNWHTSNILTSIIYNSLPSPPSPLS